jgi:ParD-like antitoxin of type II bacterial toxin-antitoxin system
MRRQIKISNELAEKAIAYGISSGLDASNQIEHWAKIGKAAEENPDFPYSIIKCILPPKDHPLPFKMPCIAGGSATPTRPKQPSD